MMQESTLNKSNMEIKDVLSEKDKTDTLAFLRTALSHEMTDEIWNWEFEQNRERTVLSIIKDMKSSEILGTQFMIPVILNIRNRTCWTGKSENTYIHHSLRGKGMFGKVYDHAINISVKKGLSYLWGFTSAIKVFRDKLKFQVFENIMCTSSIELMRPNRSHVKNGSLIRLLVKLMFFYSWEIRKKWNKNKAKKRSGFELKDRIDNYSDLDAVFNDMKRKYGEFNHIEIDKEYIDWRVNQNPNLNYRTIAIYKDNTIEGYLVYVENKNGFFISDFTICGKEQGEVLLSELISKAKEKEVRTISYFGNIDNKANEVIFGLFKNNGAEVKINEDMNFVIKKIGEDESESSTKTKNWYINGLWTEGFSI